MTGFHMIGSSIMKELKKTLKSLPIIYDEAFYENS